MSSRPRSLPEPKPAKELTKWIETQMLPLVVPFTEQFMNLIFTGPAKVPVPCFCDHVPNSNQNVHNPCPALTHTTPRITPE